MFGVVSFVQDYIEFFMPVIAEILCQAGERKQRLAECVKEILINFRIFYFAATRGKISVAFVLK